LSQKKSHTTQSRKVLPWAAMAILVLGASIIAAMYWQQNLRVKSVVIEGNYFTPGEDILHASGITVGIKPDSLDLELAIENIERLDYVYQVTPYVDALGKVNLSVQERLPIALLIEGSHEIYVDAYGVKLPIITGKTRNLPLVYGFDASSDTDTLSSKEFIQVRDFLVSALTNQFGWTTISEVVYHPYDGVVALSHENGVKLLFGQNDFDEKLENWEAFYSEIIAVKGIQSMQQVDLRFTNQVVTREAS